MPPKRRDDRPRGDAALRSALEAASSCETFEDLKTALDAFDGCPLKAMANNLVFADGDAKREVVLVGEAPAARKIDGAGHLRRPADGWTAMLASIGWTAAMSLSPTRFFGARPGTERRHERRNRRLPAFSGKADRHRQPSDSHCCSAVRRRRPCSGSKESVSKLRGRWHGARQSGMSQPIAAHGRSIIRPTCFGRRRKSATLADLLSLQQALSEY